MEFKKLGVEIKEIDEKQRIVTAVVSTSDLDDGGDIILPGAYEETIKNDFRRIKMLWQHKSDMPIGRPIKMQQMPDGQLMTESYVSKIQKGEDYLTLAEEEIVTEFSIGYVAEEFDRRSDGGRDIKKVKLFEYSPVTWGMNANTGLLSIKSIEDAMNPRELERILCEAGYSNSQAKRIASVGIKSLREADEESKTIDEQELKALSDAIKSFNKSLTGQE